MNSSRPSSQLAEVVVAAQQLRLSAVCFSVRQSHSDFRISCARAARPRCSVTPLASARRARRVCFPRQWGLFRGRHVAAKPLRLREVNVMFSRVYSCMRPDMWFVRNRQEWRHDSVQCCSTSARRFCGVRVCRARKVGGTRALRVEYAVQCTAKAV